MMDAVIDEIDGRMIRVGDQWLADFASCNYLGFDLDREIIEADPGLPRRVGHAPELVAPARQPGAVRADRGAPDRAARLRGLARPADDHPHPHVGDPGARRRRARSSWTPARTRRSTTAARSRARAAPRSSASASRTPTISSELLSAERDPTRARLHGRREQHDRQRARPAPRSPRVARQHGALLYVDDAHGFGVIGERSPDETCPYGMRGNSIVRHVGETYDDIVLVGGFSKAYSSLLAFIACPTRAQGAAQGRRAALPVLGAVAGRVARDDARRLRRERAPRRRAAGRPLPPAPAASWTRCDRLGVAHAEPLRLPDHRDPARATTTTSTRSAGSCSTAAST